jgi:hypothetical protein
MSGELSLPLRRRLRGCFLGINTGRISNYVESI